MLLCLSYNIFSQRLSHNVFLTMYISQRLSHKEFLATSNSQCLSHNDFPQRLSHNDFLTSFLQSLSRNVFLTMYFSLRLSHNVVITFFYNIFVLTTSFSMLQKMLAFRQFMVDRPKKTLTRQSFNTCMYIKYNIYLKNNAIIHVHNLLKILILYSFILYSKEKNILLKRK